MLTWARFFSQLFRACNAATTERPTMQRHKLRFFYYVTRTDRFTFDGTAIILIVRLFHSIHEGIQNR